MISFSRSEAHVLEYMGNTVRHLSKGHISYKDLLGISLRLMLDKRRLFIHEMLITNLSSIQSIGSRTACFYNVSKQSDNPA